MLHHLPRPVRQEFAREMRRVLKPAGRVLVVDFGSGGDGRRGLLAHFHRYGHTNPREVIALLEGAALSPVESGALGMNDLQFVLAKPRPCQPPGGERAKDGDEAIGGMQASSARGAPRT